MISMKTDTNTNGVAENELDARTPKSGWERWVLRVGESGGDSPNKGQVGRKPYQRTPARIYVVAHVTLPNGIEVLVAIRNSLGYIVPGSWLTEVMSHT
jgi:hypothetical protein